MWRNRRTSSNLARGQISTPYVGQFLIVKRKHIYILQPNMHDTEDLVHAKVLFICLRKQMSVLEGDIFVQGKDPRI